MCPFLSSVLLDRLDHFPVEVSNIVKCITKLYLSKSKDIVLKNYFDKSESYPHE